MYWLIGIFGLFLNIANVLLRQNKKLENIYFHILGSIPAFLKLFSTRKNILLFCFYHEFNSI